MKRLFALLLLFPVLVFADVDTKDGASITEDTDMDGFTGTIGGVDGGGAPVADCSGDLMFSYHFENDLDITQGTPCGCVDAGGDSTATANNSATFEAANNSDGTYAGDYPGASDWHDFGSATVQNFNDEEGKLNFDIYITTFVNGADVLQISNGTDTLTIQMQNVNTDIHMRADWFADSNHEYATTPTGNGHAEGELKRVYYYWKRAASNADHQLIICDLTPPDSTSNCSDSGAGDNIDDFTSGAINDFEIGVCDGNAADVHIDNLEVYATSGL
jgi:hypothetical protein